jgi:hypothetical protein
MVIPGRLTTAGSFVWATGDPAGATTRRLVTSRGNSGGDPPGRMLDIVKHSLGRVTAARDECAADGVAEVDDHGEVDDHDADLGDDRTLIPVTTAKLIGTTPPVPSLSDLGKPDGDDQCDRKSVGFGLVSELNDSLM